MEKIAVIGGGISGMVAAWMLREKYNVTLFESGDYLGGHTHTHQIELDGGTWNVDSGFIVFNDKTYPFFTQLLRKLQVERRPTAMSFSVTSPKDNLEYNGTTIRSLFAQRRNFFRPKFWRMIQGILKFNQECKNLLKQPVTSETLGEFLARKNLPHELSKFYIKPMAASVWSAGTKTIHEIPIFFLARFFENHGFLNIDDRPQWYTVQGGSKTYALKIAADLGSRLHMSTKCDQITSQGSKVKVRVGGQRELEFDQVIFAGHSDEALRALSQPSSLEREVLGAIPYTANEVLLHTDDKILPKRPLAWAAWNYHLFDEHMDAVAVTYHMNILQGLTCPTQVLVSLNCEDHIKPGKVLKRLRYHHPVFTPEATKAQLRHHEVSGVHRIHYCGAYWFNGFHEDGVRSALRVVKKINPSLLNGWDGAADL